MSERISSTRGGDAPLSTAKDSNPAAAGVDPTADQDDVLVGRTVSINRTPQELYEFWRDFRNLPLFMENIHSVEVFDARRSHWVVAAPAGATVEWDSTVTEDVPGEVIAWRSNEDASVRNSGRITFRDSGNGRGTWVTATLVYDPPAGTVGKLVAKLFQREPNIQARRDLRRFKQLMETGEIATSQPPEAAPRAE
jgi:uncharacterized membrane protein